MLRCLCFAVFLSVGSVFSAEPIWHTSLFLDGGGVWTKRYPIDIFNQTEHELIGISVPVTLPFVPEHDLRVVHQNGTEVVYGTSGQTLFIPIEAKPNEKVRYYAYIGNPKAWRIPPQDFIQAKAGLVNGDFETGGELSPDNWTFDDNDETHRIFWSDEKPFSGKKCVKTTVEKGAEPSWIAARQSSLPIVPGAKYRLCGYVKAENCTGIVGFYIHLGPEGKPFTSSPMFNAGDGTYDWKKVTQEFTAPADATSATLGTVLRGTGTSWHDNVTLEVLDKKESSIQAAIGQPENCPLQIDAAFFAEDKWHPDYDCRTTFRVINDTDEDMRNVSVLFELRGFYAHGKIGAPCNILVVCKNTETKGKLIDSENKQVSATISLLPKRTIRAVHVYYQIDEKAVNTAPVANQPIGLTAHPELQKRTAPFDSLQNLLKNGSFENGDDAWEGSRSVIETDSRIVPFGKQCLRLETTEKDVSQWLGKRQSVPVKAGSSYLVSGWMRCENLLGGANVHIHFLDSNGKNLTMTSVFQGIRGTADWTRASQIFTAPLNATKMTVHLTTNQSGKLWHDNFVVLDSLLAEATSIESHQNAGNPIAWSVPAVMKVFPQTLPPTQIEPFVMLSAARNEKEPLQLAIRPNSFVGKMKISVSEMKDKSGNTLPAPEIRCVGYVPVDYPSSYYNEKTPKWHRKNPRTSPGCDGWTGIWPDPLLANDTIDFKKGDGTHSAWILWDIPKSAKSGIYQGFVHVGEIKIPVNFTVRAFFLPEKSNVSAIYDARFTGPSKIWPSDIFTKAVNYMGENRIMPDAIRPEPKLTFDENAEKSYSPQFDWKQFDETATHLFDDLHVRFLYTPNLFYAFGWGHPPRDFYGEKPYSGEWPFKDADKTQLRPEYKAKYQAALRAFWNHVKEKGWAEKFVLYVSDEPNFWTDEIKQQMIAVCDMIHEVDAKIPIYCSTWHYVPEWKNSLDVWGIGHYGIVAPEKMKEILDHGSRIWFTTDGMLCLDTPYNAIERLLPHYCFKYGAEAYEFWGIGWLTYSPWDYGFHSFIHQTSTPGEYYWVRYPNGDGYLLYPEKHGFSSSIRFEQAREGVEDYEYLIMLQKLIHSREKKGVDVSAAKKMLQEAQTLVDCPTPVGRYSSKILPNPLKLYEIRDKIAAAIEQFSP